MSIGWRRTKNTFCSTTPRPGSFTAPQKAFASTGEDAASQARSSLLGSFSTSFRLRLDPPAGEPPEHLPHQRGPGPSPGPALWGGRKLPETRRADWSGRKDWSRSEGSERSLCLVVLLVCFCRLCCFHREVPAIAHSNKLKHSISQEFLLIGKHSTWAVPI